MENQNELLSKIIHLHETTLEEVNDLVLKQLQETQLLSSQQFAACALSKDHDLEKGTNAGLTIDA
jgi:hypothetical protein